MKLWDNPDENVCDRKVSFMDYASNSMLNVIQIRKPFQRFNRLLLPVNVK